MAFIIERCLVVGHTVRAVYLGHLYDIHYTVCFDVATLLWCTLFPFLLRNMAIHQNSGEGTIYVPLLCCVFFLAAIRSYMVHRILTLPLAPLPDQSYC